MKKKNQCKEIYGIIGLGRFGMALAKEFALSKKEFICCDIDEKKVREILTFNDDAYIVEDSSMETLKSIGIDNCTTVVVAIGEDLSKSILTTLNVIRLGVKNVIAKATNEDQGEILKTLGAVVIYPERDIALRLAKKLINKNVMEFLEISEDVEINEIIIPESFVGVSVVESHMRKKYGLNIIAIDHEGTIITDIDINYVFAPSDKIVVIGRKDNIEKFKDIA